MENTDQALYYISLICEAKDHNTDDENGQWQMANQNRLNQNFMTLANRLDAINQRLTSIEQGD